MLKLTALEERGSLQDEISEYMAFLDEQMDDMMLDPTPNKEFLGNTYKWWASLLAADDVSVNLKQLSIPIYLAHGVEDNTIPVLSADCAAEALREANALTYLRLEGYGHDLDNVTVQAAACQWLKSILFGEEQSESNPIVINVLSAASSSVDWKTDISHYAYSRGNGKVSVDTKGHKDTEGNQSASGGVSVSKKTDSGVELEGHVRGNMKQDRHGKSKGDVEVGGSLNWEF